MKIHRFAKLFPMLPDEEMQTLADDIKKRGLQQPITIDEDGMILDGRNRAAACKIAGVKLETITFEGSEADKLAFVLSSNLHRRHMSTAERARIAAKIATMEVGENQYTRTKKGEGSSFEPPSKPVSQEQAAKLVGVSVSSVKRAKGKANQQKEKPAKKPPASKPLTRTEPLTPYPTGKMSDYDRNELKRLFDRKGTPDAEVGELNVDSLCQWLHDKLSTDQVIEVCQWFMDKLGWKRERKAYKNAE